MRREIDLSIGIETTTQVGRFTPRLVWSQTDIKPEGTVAPNLWREKPMRVLIDEDFEIPNPDKITEGLLQSMREWSKKLSGIELAEKISEEVGLAWPHTTPLQYLLLPVDSVRRLVRRTPTLIPWSTTHFDMGGISTTAVKEHQTAVRMYALRAGRQLTVGNVHDMDLTEFAVTNHSYGKGQLNAQYVQALVGKR